VQLFGQVIRTLVNVILLPVAVVKDVLTLGGVCTMHDGTYTMEQVQRIKDEAEEGGA